MATISVVAVAPQGRRATWYPWSLLAVGAVVSVSGNAVHAAVAADVDVPTVLAATIASVPPLVLLAITHLTVQLSRTRQPAATPMPMPPGATSSTEQPPHTRTSGQSGTSVAAVGGRREVALARHREGWSNRRIARELGVHPSTVGRWLSVSPSDAGDTLSAGSAPGG